MKHFNASIQFAFVLTMFTTSIQAIIWPEVPINLWELAATATSYSCTYMCVKQTRWNYPMAILSTSLLAYVFWSSNLLASAALNLYLIPTVIYGYFIWGKDTETKPVEHVHWKSLIQYLFFTAVAYFGAVWVVEHFGGKFSMLDSWLLIGSIFAQFLLDRKKVETWIVWAMVNIVSIYVYYNSGLYLLAMQFTVFLLNTCYGWYEWYRSMKKEDLNVRTA